VYSIVTTKLQIRYTAFNFKSHWNSIMGLFGNKKPDFLDKLGLSDRQFEIIKNITSYVASFLVLKHLIIALFGNIMMIFASPLAGILGIITTTVFITLTLVSLVYGFATTIKNHNRPNWLFYSDLISILYFTIWI